MSESDASRVALCIVCHEAWTADTVCTQCSKRPLFANRDEPTEAEEAVLRQLLEEAGF